jgi:hypothetical protein
VILLALSVTSSVYAGELSMTPFGVANPVRIEITFTTATDVTQIGFASDDAPELTCGARMVSSYSTGPAFALGATSPRVAYFNGYLPALAGELELCVHTNTGTISLDGVITDHGQCPAQAGCYSYTCDSIGGNITSITPITPFTATCL